MEKVFASFLAVASFVCINAPLETVYGQRRVVVRPNRVVVRRPVVRTKIVVRPGHPIRRVLPAQVVVRSPRRVVTVPTSLVFLPAITWRTSTAVLPPAERLVWQDTESIGKDEGWVDANFGIDAFGVALFLDVNGNARLNFAEITFANGQVQVVDFNEGAHRTGLYKLVDMPDGRHVKTLRILAKSETDETKLVAYLGRI